MNKLINISKRIIIIALALVLVQGIVPTALMAQAAPKIKYSLDNTKMNLGIGVKKRLKLRSSSGKTIPSNKVKWSSKRKSIATVNRYGYVTGKRKGSTKIIAKYKKKKYVCTVKVKLNQYYPKKLTPTFQDYSSDGLYYIPRKVYYKDGRLYVQTYIYNRATSIASISGGLLLSVYNGQAGDKVIAEQAFNNLVNLNLEVEPYDYTSYTFKIRASRVKLKKADLSALTPDSFVYLTY